MIDKEDNLIQVAIQEGNEIFERILNDYPQINEDDPRRCALVFSLLSNSIMQLHKMGWSEKHLISEVLDWCNVAKNLDEED